MNIRILLMKNRTPACGLIFDIHVRGYVRILNDLSVALRQHENSKPCYI